MGCEVFGGLQPHRPKAEGMRPVACGPHAKEEVKPRE